MHAEDARERHRDDREDEADDEPFSTGSEMNEARKPQPDEAATKPQTPVTIASAMGQLRDIGAASSSDVRRGTRPRRDRRRARNAG